MVKQSIVAEGCGHTEMLTLWQTRNRESWGSEEGLETMYSLQEYMTNDPSPPARPHLPIPCSAMNSWMNQSAHEIRTLMLRSPLGGLSPPMGTKTYRSVFCEDTPHVNCNRILPRAVLLSSGSVCLSICTLSNFLSLQMVLQEYLYEICLSCLSDPAPELKMFLIGDFSPTLFIYFCTSGTRMV